MRLLETSRAAQAVSVVAVLGLSALCLMLISRRPARPMAAASTEGMVLIAADNVWLGASTGQLRAHAEALATINGDAELIAQFVDLCDGVPRARAFVPAFWIDEYEVTNGEYARFVAETGHPPPPYWNGRAPPEGRNRHPVTNVSGDDAAAYAAWAGKQLPTEAQWLRAFRGDTEMLYPWGNDWRSQLANTAQNSAFAVGTSAVEESPLDRSTLGVHNLVGNVCEIIRDRDKSSGRSMCVVKGSDTGSNGDIYGVAPARRLIAPGDIDQMAVGFRCVLEEPRR